MIKHRILPLTILLIFSILFLSCCGDKETGKIPITTKSKQALNYYIKGRELQENLRAQDARQLFEKAVTADSSFALGYFSLALVQPNNRSFLKLFNKAKDLTENASLGEQLMIYGVDAAINGLPQQQLNLYIDLVNAYPGDERAFYLLGNMYYGQQEYKLALTQYYKAIVINSEFAPCYNQMGYAHRNLGEVGKAKTAFKKYIQLIPNDPNPLDSFAELLLKYGKYEASMQHYKMALDLNPNFVPSYLGIATNLNLMERHEEAREQLQSIFKIARNDAERRAAHFATAVSYVDEGMPEKALEELQVQFSIAEKLDDPNNMAQDLITMGNILLETGKVTEARKKYLRAAELIESSDLPAAQKENARRTALYYGGRIKIAENKLDSAKILADNFREAARIIENQFLFRLCRELHGTLAIAKGDYKAAIDELKHGDQQNAYIPYYLSLAYKAVGDSITAEEFLEKAREFNALNSMNYAFVRNKPGVRE